MNVVSLADSGASSICENPELASSFENTFVGGCDVPWIHSGLTWLDPHRS